MSTSVCARVSVSVSVRESIYIKLQKYLAILSTLKRGKDK
jgi:hypothetical protein